MQLDEGSIVMLQAFYDIFLEKEKQTTRTPNMSILRKSLFWDTEIANLNWEEQYKAIIRRVYARGNAEEKAEISRFYGHPKVLETPKKQSAQVAKLVTNVRA